MALSPPNPRRSRPAGHRHYRRRERHPGFRHGSRGRGLGPRGDYRRGDIPVGDVAAPTGVRRRNFPSNPLTARRPLPLSVAVRRSTATPCPCCSERAGRCLRDQKRLSAVDGGPSGQCGNLAAGRHTWLHPHPTPGACFQRPNDSPTPKKQGSRGCDLAPYTRGATRLGLGPTGVALVSVRRVEA